MSADLLNRAAMVSYAKSIDIVTGGKISRNTDLDQRIGAKKKYIELIHEVDVNKKTNNNLTRPACRCHLTVRPFTEYDSSVYIM